MIGSFVLVALGHDAAGSVLGGLNITGIVLAFLSSNNSSPKKKSESPDSKSSNKESQKS